MIAAMEPGPPAAEGFLLAGGASSRFGSEKSLALLSRQPEGTPLIAHAVDLVRAAGLGLAGIGSDGLGVRIAGARSSALAAYAAVIPDAIPGFGPLSGIHAALEAAASEYALFLPVDMPLIPAGLLTLLLGRAAITCASVTCLRVSGLLQPFPVLLHRTTLPRISAALEAPPSRRADWHDFTRRSASCFRLWQSFPDLDAPALECLLQAGQMVADPIPPALWFGSANTAADLVDLRRWLALRAASRSLEA